MSNSYYAVTYTVAGTTNRVVFHNLPDAEEFVNTGLWWAKNNNAVIVEHKCPEDSELTSSDRHEAVVTVFNNDNDKSDVYTITMDDDYHMTSDCNVQTLDEDLNVINQFEMATPSWIFDIYESEITEKLSR